MKIWITGICGFLGSHLAQALLGKGHFIVGNDNMLCGELKNIAWTNLGLKLISIEDEELDCCDFDGMAKAMTCERPDVLIHCAATAHEGLSNFSPSFITRNIYEASVATFSAAIASGVKRIIFMSSMARYGNGDSEPPFKECYHPYPIDPYGIAKVAAEETLKALCRLHGIEYVIAVPHNIIGPRQRYCDPYRNVAAIMINRALQNKPILVYGDGQQKRCFSPIADCLQSLVRMVDATVSGEVINIGPDKHQITILELVEMIRDATGNNVEIQHLPDRPNEVKDAYCSSDKARELLGFRECQPLSSCLDDMVAYIKANGTRPFIYNFPIEIEKGAPKTWTKKLI